ncbi:MAG TPA: FMN-binding negative transcriptional regulator [Pseudomonadales bacterium]
MYIPKHFALDDRAAQFDLIDRYPFGALTTVSHGRLSISTIPFVLERERGALDGHIARANPHWREFADISDLRVVFVGPNAYISPTWYQSPNMVPTWNYVAVEVGGRIEVLEGRAARLDLVDRLSARHEAQEAQPWRSDKMDSTQRDKLLDAIVAFRIQIESIVAKLKLGQNRRTEELLAAAEALDARDRPSHERQLAALMRGAVE